MYYLGKNGQQSGPFSMEQLQTMATSGQIAPADLLWTQGMAEWKPASSILSGVFPAQPTPPTPGVEPTASAVPPPPPSRPATPPNISAGPAEPIPNYLWQSIAVTLCCCLPLGIVAIIFASQVSSKSSAGNIAGATESSRKAKMWCLISLGVGVVVHIITVIFYAFMFASMPAGQLLR